MKRSIAAKAKAYSRSGNREKTRKRIELRIEINAASRQAHGFED